MKFINALLTLALAATTSLAQNGFSVVIESPANGATVQAGSNITVEIDRPVGPTFPDEVAIIIALQTGSPTDCLAPSGPFISGEPILYLGPYNPVFHPLEPPFKPAYQNFSVVVPGDMAKGSAQLSVTHLSLTGADLNIPFYDYHSITLNVV